MFPLRGIIIGYRLRTASIRGNIPTLEAFQVFLELDLFFFFAL